MADTMLLIVILLFVQGSFANDVEHTEHDIVPQDGQISDTLVTALWNQLEKKLEERDQQHDMVIAALRADYQRDLADMRQQLDTQKEQLGRQTKQLNKQAKRIALLETSSRRQKQQIKSLLKELAVPKPIRNGSMHDVRGERAVQQITTSMNSKQRIRREENDVDVAFFTTLSATSSHLGTNQTIVFDNVITNIGNAYDPDLGSFIAPASGTYVISVSLMTYNHHTAHYGLYKNTTRLVRLYVHGYENAWDSDSKTAVIHLTQGDDVTVKHNDLDHGLYGSNYCAFSGFLLTQDFTDNTSPIVGK